MARAQTKKASAKKASTKKASTKKASTKKGSEKTSRSNFSAAPLKKAVKEVCDKRITKDAVEFLQSSLDKMCRADIRYGVRLVDEVKSKGKKKRINEEIAVRVLERHSCNDRRNNGSSIQIKLADVRKSLKSHLDQDSYLLSKAAIEAFVFAYSVMLEDYIKCAAQLADLSKSKTLKAEHFEACLHIAKTLGAHINVDAY